MIRLQYLLPVHNAISGGSENYSFLRVLEWKINIIEHQMHFMFHIKHAANIVSNFV